MRWALISLRQRSSLEIERCTLTSTCAERNLAARISFVHVEGEASSDSMKMMGGMSTSIVMPISVRLKDCIARGGASFLHATYPVDLDWSNGLVALSEPLFAGQVRSGDSRIGLRNVTARLPKGFCSFDSSVFKLSATVENCVLAGSAKAPLIDQEGVDGVASLRKRFAWRGDANRYEQISLDGNPPPPQVFWRINGGGAWEDVVGFDAWQGQWPGAENPAPRKPGSIWRTPLEEHGPLLHEHVPQQYLLQSEVGDIGFRLDDLPKPPSSDTARASSAAPSAGTSATTPATMQESEEE
jgi:hypothetical protein